MGKKWRARSAASVVAEIDFWQRAGYLDFNFVDSNFFFDKARVLEICRGLADRGLNITLSADGLRAEDAERGMLERMKQCGLKSVAIGVESANEGILRNIKKGETLSQIKSAIKTCLALDIEVALFFIIGLPGETRESVEESFEFALRYPVSEVYFHNANPIPGTELYNWTLENKYLLSSREDMLKNTGGMGGRPLIATPQFGFNERRRMYKKGLRISKKVRINSYKRRNGSWLKWFLVNLKNRLGM
jgi:radical SAM superfamily enzyme YgiQ (UPF0313 family)